jgi:hypothetical protein
MRRSQYAHAPGYNLDTWPGPSLVKIAHIGTAQGAVKVGRINDVAVLSRHRSRVMGVAFEMTRVAPGIADRLDQVNETVAKTIMELARQGESNPDLLCERALQSLRAQYL